MVPSTKRSLSRFNNTGYNPTIIKINEITILSIILWMIYIAVLAILYNYKMNDSSDGYYFILIFNLIPIISGGFITPMAFYFLEKNLRHFYFQMFWEKAPNCLQRFNPGHNLLPKNINVHNNVVKSFKPEIDVIMTNEEIGNDNNDDSDNDDNWWKQSTPGPSLQMCSGNQKWYCEVHRVPLNKTFDKYCKKYYKI